ncbi:MAG: hypothetical protein IJ920_04025 [Paludibacteraceae bacterium]|nr:hypothetical protein [Paludibacteraceae bacterium]
MKKYITPNTEYTYLTLTGHILSVSQENSGSMNTSPNTSGDSPNAVRRKVF